jgi:hypothetical protein
MSRVSKEKMYSSTYVDGKYHNLHGKIFVKAVFYAWIFCTTFSTASSAAPPLDSTVLEDAGIDHGMQSDSLSTRVDLIRRLCWIASCKYDKSGAHPDTSYRQNRNQILNLRIILT